MERQTVLVALFLVYFASVASAWVWYYSPAFYPQYCIYSCFYPAYSYSYFYSYNYYYSARYSPYYYQAPQVYYPYYYYPYSGAVVIYVG